MNKLSKIFFLISIMAVSFAAQAASVCRLNPATGQFEGKYGDNGGPMYSCALKMPGARPDAANLHNIIAMNGTSLVAGAADPIAEKVEGAANAGSPGAAASGKAGVSTAAVATPTATPGECTFRITREDGKLSTVLERWSKLAGYQPSWEIKGEEPVISLEASFCGETFLQALESVLSSYQSTTPIQAVIWQKNNAIQFISGSR